MIFRQVEEIKSGQKTQTRRVVKDGDQGWIHHNTGIMTTVTSNYRTAYKFGGSYAIVPKRGAKAIPDGRIEITAIRQERLQDISEADAQAEGVTDVAAYRALWESINTTPGVRWEDNPQVWVYSFRFVPALVQVELF